MVDEAGIEVGSARRLTPFATVRDGVEAGADDLMAAVAGVLADLGSFRDRVAGAGVAGLAESGAPLDGRGAVLAPVLAWHDPRGGETVTLLEARFGDELALAVGQRLRTVSSVAKLGWLTAHGLTGVRRWLGVPELVLNRLTGVEATDYSLAARSGAFDVRHRRPLPEVLAMLGLPAGVFPDPSPAGSVMGRVVAAGAAWSGLPAGIPVTVAGHDHLVGAAGAGAAAGDVGNSVGTAETLLARSSRLPDLEAAVDRRLAVGLAPEGDEWAVLAGAGRAGLVVDAAASLLCSSPAALDELAAGVEAVDARDWVDAAVAVGRRAGDVTLESGALPAGPPGAVWNGVLRALSLLTWDAVARVEEIAGPGRRLLVFGGGSRSRPWLDAKAATGHLPVVRSGATDAAARGAALYAGVAAGWWPTAGAAPSP